MVLDFTLEVFIVLTEDVWALVGWDLAATVGGRRAMGNGWHGNQCNHSGNQSILMATGV